MVNENRGAALRMHVPADVLGESLNPHLHFGTVNTEGEAGGHERALAGAANDINWNAVVFQSSDNTEMSKPPAAPVTQHKRDAAPGEAASDALHILPQQTRRWKHRV